eukprot:4853691-Pyramimonas_sp.AAC.1
MKQGNLTMVDGNLALDGGVPWQGEQGVLELDVANPTSSRYIGRRALWSVSTGAFSSFGLSVCSARNLVVSEDLACFASR